MSNYGTAQSRASKDERDYRTIQLFRDAGLTWAEIAVAIRATSAAAQSRWKKLRERYGERGEDGRL